MLESESKALKKELLIEKEEKKNLEEKYYSRFK